MRVVIVLAVVLVSCVAQPATTQDPTSTSVRGNGGERALYLTDAMNGSNLKAIDGIHLGDLSSEPLLPIGQAACATCALVASSNGGTLAVVHYSSSGVPEIGVYDLRARTLRARPNPEVPLIVDALSDDGSRIYARNWPPTDITAERLVLDAATGKVVVREPAIDVGGELITWISRVDERRLYALLSPADRNATGPRQVEVAAWDLRTGNVLWRRDVPSLLAGGWGTVGALSDRRSRLVPGFAISPDGGRLAVVRAFDCCVPGGMLWLADSSNGEILSQRPYVRDASVFDHLFPAAIAAAKDENSVTVNATFSRDGQLLYVFAESWQYDGRAEPYQYLGMTAVDVNTSRIVGSDIKMEPWWYQNHISWVMPSTDGRWVYVFLERTGNAVPRGFVLRRVDARTLSVLRERRFDSVRHSFVLAAP